MSVEWRRYLPGLAVLLWPLAIMTVVAWPPPVWVVAIFGGIALAWIVACVGIEVVFWWTGPGRRRSR